MIRDTPAAAARFRKVARGLAQGAAGSVVRARAAASSTGARGVRRPRPMKHRLVESPVELLKAHIRDLEDQVPRLNEHLFTLKARVTLGERELERLRGKRLELEEKVARAGQEGRPDVAWNYRATLQEVEAEGARQERELRQAREAFELAQAQKRAFMAGKEALILAAKGALRDARQAEWNRQVSRALGAFHSASARVVEEDARQVVARFRAEAADSEAELRAVLERLVAARETGPDGLALALGALREDVAALERRLAGARELLDACERRLASGDD